MSGHTGTSLREINAVIWIVPLAAFLLAAISQLLKWHPAPQLSQCSVEQSNHSFLKKPMARTLDTCVLVLPQIAVMMGVMPPELCAASIAALACLAAIVLITRILSSKREYQSQIAQKAAILIGSRQARWVARLILIVGCPIKCQIRLSVAVRAVCLGDIVCVNADPICIESQLHERVQRSYDDVNLHSHSGS